MNVDTPDGVNAMLRATPGSVSVSYGGVDGHGHTGLPVGMAFENPDLMDGKPAVVVAAGYFPDICVDEVQGLTGIRGTNIVVGDYEWMISRALDADGGGVAASRSSGGLILLLLTDPA